MYMSYSHIFACSEGICSSELFIVVELILFHASQAFLLDFVRDKWLLKKTNKKNNNNNSKTVDTIQQEQARKHEKMKTKNELSQPLRLWCLSHRRQATAQASLRMRAVPPEPSLFAHMKYGRRRRIPPKIRHLAPLHVCLKNEFTEDEKCHLMTWLILLNHDFLKSPYSYSVRVHVVCPKSLWQICDTNCTECRNLSGSGSG